MQNVIFFIVTVMLICISSTHAFSMTYLYASPSGSGTGISLESPASLADVKKLAQSYTGMDNVTVYLRGGTYQVASALHFGPADSGKNGYVVLWRNYPGDEKVTISGGVKITGWALHDAAKNIWRASVPAGYNSRQLWVNGLKAERTKWVNGTHVETTRISAGLNYYIQRYNDASFPVLDYPTDVELHAHGRSPSSQFIFLNWRHNIYGVTAVSRIGNNTYFTLAPGAKAATDLQGNMTTPSSYSWIENAYEFLNSYTKGQYFFPSTENYIYYVPRDGENMANVDAWIPHAENIIFSPSGLANITFLGISFQHAGWLKPSIQGSFIEAQANNYLDVSNGYKAWWDNAADEAAFPKAAVEIHGGNNVNFLQCEFKHLGGQGLKYGLGSVNSEVIGNVFTDIAAAGIHIGSAYFQDAHPSTGRRTSNITIQSNLIYDIGNQYSGATGIFVGYGEFIKVKHNTIHTTPYTGISVGWGWSAMTEMWHDDYDWGLGFIDYSNNNEVAYNLIYDVMQELFDGGAIYSVGEQSNSAIYNNYIYNVGNFYDTSGDKLHLQYNPIYCDEGSRYQDIYSNLILRPEVIGPYKWLTANLESSYSDFSTRNNFFEAPLTTVFYYGIPGTNTNNTAITADSSSWPAAARAIASQAGTELLVVGDIIENEAVIYGWKEQEGDIIEIRHGSYTLKGYEESDPLRWRAVISNVTDYLAQLQVTSTRLNLEKESAGSSGGNDLCVNDADKMDPGICGCGVPDIDMDNDGTPDCNDLCVNDAGKIEPGICGCGVADTDTDRDEVIDCIDDCTQASTEVCDGTDNDCDGEVDEGCNVLPPVKLGDRYYNLIQSAYDSIPEGNTDTVTIKIQAGVIMEHVHFDRNISVSLAGGYDAFFNNQPTGKTTLSNYDGEVMPIISGKLITHDIILK